MCRSIVLLAMASSLWWSAPPGLAAGASDPLPLEIPLAAPQIAKDVQNRIYCVAQRQAHSLLAGLHPWNNDPTMRLLTESKSTEHWIRPNSGTLEGLAFLHRFGPYDEQIVGVSRSDLLTNAIIPMMRYLVTTHVTGTQQTGDGKMWGDAWQSAYWAHMLGRAAWFVWPNLPENLRDGVRRVVAHEADRIAGSQPPHQLRADTKAEENAWNSQVLSAAMLLMPQDPRASQWSASHQKWVMSSFLRPADAQNDAIVDGRPVRAQFTGANIFDDFTLENHSIVHPDYMTTTSLLLGCAPDFAMTRRPLPEAVLFNVLPVYQNLKWMLLPDGNFVYPNGQDWEVFRAPAWLLTHVLTSVWAGDPQAWQWVLRTLDTTEKMQDRSVNGAVFFPGEYFFPSTQSDLLRALGRCWLSLQLAPNISHSPQDFEGVKRWNSAAILLRRAPDAVHTVSWGARIMAQCVPRRLDRLVSPHERNGVGHIRLAGQSIPLPLSLANARVREGTNSFAATLLVDHGAAIRATLEFRSEPDSSFRISEHLTALTNVTTAEISTGLIGILNNPHWIYESGWRRIKSDTGRIEVPSGSGRKWNLGPTRSITIDDSLRIESGEPLNAACLAASEAVRGRVTDQLVLNLLDGNRSWNAGQAISEYHVRITVHDAQKPSIRPGNR